MPIRKATRADFYAVIMMASQFMQASPYAKYCHIGKICDLLLSEERTVFIADGYQGMIAGRIIPFPYGLEPMAAEEAFWVNPESRGGGLGKELLLAFEEWAKEQGAKLISMSSIDDDVGKFIYERNGYSLYERAYLKEL